MSNLDDVREVLRKIKEPRPEEEPPAWPLKPPPKDELQDKEEDDDPKRNLPQGPAGY